MDKLDFYFKQKVGGDDLDELQTHIESHFESVLGDILKDGLINGGDVSENDTPDLTVKVTSLVGYGADGKRIEVDSQQNVDCSEDVNGNDTSVSTSGNEKWLSVYADFDWNKHDSRTDGNGDVVQYQWDEDYKFEIVQGSEASAGSAVKPDIRHDGSILLADILLDYGKTQIFNADIDEARKQKIQLSDVFNNYVDLRTYGAVGDGVVDDYSKIQQAINDSADKNKTLFIPKTDNYYYIGSNILTVPDNTKIVSNGAKIQGELNSCTLADASTGNYSTGVFENADLANGNSNIHIEGLILDGADPDPSTTNNGEATTIDHTSSLIRFENVDNLTIKNITLQRYVSNFYKSDPMLEEERGRWSVVLFKYCDDIDFKDVKFKNSQREGPNFWKCNDVYVDNYRSNNVEVCTPLHAWYCDGITVVNSILDETGTDPNCSTFNLYSKNVIIDNVRMIESKGLDLGNEAGEVFQAKNVKVTNCIIENGRFYSAGIEEQDLVDFLFEDNTIICSAGDIAFMLAHGNSIKIKDNYIEGGTTAIRFYTDETRELTNVTIEGNIINTDEDGIYIYSHGGTIKDLNILDNDIIADNGIKTLNRFGGIIEELKFSDNRVRCHELGAENPHAGYSVGVFFEYDDNDSYVDGTEIYRDIEVSDNVIFADGAWVFFKLYPTDPRVTSQDIICRDNVFKPATTAGCELGIRFDYCEDVLIKDNICFDALNDFIRLGGPVDVELIGNRGYAKNVTAGNFLNIYGGTPSGKLLLIDNYGNDSGMTYRSWEDLSGITEYLNERNRPQNNIGMTATDWGSTANIPDPSNPLLGFGHQYFDNTIDRPLFNDGANFVDLAVWEEGTTANRPGSPTKGQRYFDTDLGKPIWYNGSSWVDATGTTV